MLVVMIFKLKLFHNIHLQNHDLGGFVLLSPVNVKGRTKGKQFLFLSNMHFESKDPSAVVELLLANKYNILYILSII